MYLSSNYYEMYLHYPDPWPGYHLLTLTPEQQTTTELLLQHIDNGPHPHQELLVIQQTTHRSKFTIKSSPNCHKLETWEPNTFPLPHTELLRQHAPTSLTQTTTSPHETTLWYIGASYEDRAASLSKCSTRISQFIATHNH